MTTRRTLLRGAAGMMALVVIPLPLHATPDEVAASILETFGSDTMEAGPITLEAPPLAETGNSVPITITVDSPMTGDDRITRLAVFAEANPRPKVAEVHFGPGAAEAFLATNIRLNATQRIICIAETASGRLWRAEHEVSVVVGACTTLDVRF